MAEPATQILLNVQTDSLRTAVIVSQMYPNRISIGVTAQRFPALDEGIALIRQTHENGVLVSAGLGDGAADQWQRALDLALALRGLRHFDELARVAEVAVSRNMMIEPTAGLTPKNLPSILETCIGAGARRIMPHLYTSVEDPRTRDLDLGLVGDAMATIDRAQQLGVE